jgi:hypothetical protein
VLLPFPPELLVGENRATLQTLGVDPGAAPCADESNGGIRLRKDAAPDREHMLRARVDVERRIDLVHASSAGERTESSKRTSLPPTSNSSGGRPARLANTGAASGCLGLPEPRYQPAISSRPAREHSMSRLAWVVIVSPLQVRSAHADSVTMPAGREIPRSRKAMAVASARPPPAESPTIAALAGVTPEPSSHRHAEMASSTAAGNGCSGAKR